MKQYYSVKEKYPEALLLFQMGDFYETFHEDAVNLAEAISITLTKRGKEDGEPIPLAGFPMKALDGYLPKLISHGYRVVICDQVEDAKHAKGVVKRDVTRIVTPGTVLEEALLDPTRANHIVALMPEKARASKGEAPSVNYGAAWVELTTGTFQLAMVSDSAMPALLARLQPSEILASEALKDEARDRVIELERRCEASLSIAPDWTFNGPQAHKLLCQHFNVATLEGFGVEDDGGKGKSAEIQAAGALLAYLKDQQRSELTHIAKLEPYSLDGSLSLDPATVAALEIVETLRSKQRKHTLFWALDHCQTSMGSRLLRSWLLSPLTDPAMIRNRHAAIDELAYTSRRRDMLLEQLKELGDLERLAGRIGCMRASPRDLVALGAALTKVPLVLSTLSGVESTLLEEVRLRLDPVEEVRELASNAIADDPPNVMKDGGVIRDGFHADLDELRVMQRDGKRFIAKFQAKEQEESGITSLKVGYTSVFGYYLEVSNANKDRVPAHWIRKQTLKNAERYITPELKEIEARVLNAESEALSLEAKLFQQIRENIAQHAGRIAASARLLALLDVLTSHAKLAVERGYIRPEITTTRELELTDGRHPVLELTIEAARVVPNDCMLPESAPMMLITGPNMAGKSTYIRMTALLTLMAQAGCFVPAQRFKLGVVDKIFTRLGSADEIQKGNSTFMVEMVETANILNNATDRSLVVLDEVGRGTSTFDGVSIAWAITEHLADLTHARTLFATHYHELTQLASKLSTVRNYNVSVREWGEEIIFLHKIVEGGADRSYGIHVARLAGLPSSVVERSKKILARLENETAGLQAAPAGEGGPNLKRPKRVQLTLFTPAENRVMKALEALDADKAPDAVLRAELTKLKALAAESY